jgi:hypothetical protein
MFQIVATVKMNEVRHRASGNKFSQVIHDLKQNFKKLKSIIEEAGGKVEGVKLGFVNKNNRFLKAQKEIKVSKINNLT